MKSRASLSLIEQTMMLLIFALAAALCLRGFVLADTRSRTYADRDQALLCAQNAAQTLKACGGDYAAAAELCGGGDAVRRGGGAGAPGPQSSRNLRIFSVISGDDGAGCGAERMKKGDCFCSLPSNF